MKILMPALFLIFSFATQARCNGNYADHILNRALGCDIEIGLNDIPDASPAYRAVMGVCGGGCYTAIFNPAQRENCDRRYAEALNSSINVIRNYATSNGCNFDNDVIDGIRFGVITMDSPTGESDGTPSPNTPPPAPTATPEVPASPFASCFYVTEQVVEPAVSACGNTPTCIAMGYCNSGQYANQPLSLMCDAVRGRCPSFEACANAPDPSWISRGGRRGSSSINEQTFSPSNAVSR